MSALVLPAKLDLSTVADLGATISARKGGDLELDAGGVTLLGGLGLQVLAAAAAQWRQSGHSFCITPRSESFNAALDHLGVSLNDLQSTEAA
ncbi:STAS domain-containing protein [uncultured Thioclava sp.]|uniref:STAS domain-containing protein n=1 Tax=Thioclava arctica TaxID=3238301 RepID=A0ABV3TL66_9RHOB|nr:STAS domain-containing protein [uncultured Thioclava sp.]